MLPLLSDMEFKLNVIDDRLGSINARPENQSLGMLIRAQSANARCGHSNQYTSPGHPRVGGERCSSSWLDARRAGSSPRGRGTRATVNHSLDGPRVIPAWAGNASRPASLRICGAGHPRVGGERSSARCTAQGVPGSSPRGRGTRRVDVECHVGPRVIPAWAGNANSSPSRSTGPTGHPRVGGERSGDVILCHASDGSSPRGRGTLFGVHECCSVFRVIPAWAGNAFRRS